MCKYIRRTCIVRAPKMSRIHRSSCKASATVLRFFAQGKGQQHWKGMAQDRKWTDPAAINWFRRASYSHHQAQRKLKQQHCLHGLICLIRKLMPRTWILISSLPKPSHMQAYPNRFKSTISNPPRSCQGGVHGVGEPKMELKTTELAGCDGQRDRKFAMLFALCSIIARKLGR